MFFLFLFLMLATMTLIIIFYLFLHLAFLLEELDISLEKFIKAKLVVFICEEILVLLLEKDRRQRLLLFKLLLNYRLLGLAISLTARDKLGFCLALDSLQR